MLDRIFAAWAATSALHDLEPGAPEGAGAAAQGRLGVELPGTLVALARHSDGGSALHGNLRWRSLAELERDAGDPRRVVFGDDGAGGLLAVLGGHPDDAPVVLVDDDTGPDGEGLALGLAPLLRGWSAYFLALAADAHDVAAGLDRLGLPPELRALPEGGSDDEYRAIMRWAHSAEGR